MNERIKYLKSLLVEDEDVYRKRHWGKFEKYSQYLSGGCYLWCGVYSTDTRELWLMGVLGLEGIPYEKT